MNKAEIISTLNDSTGLKVKETEELLEAFVSTVEDALAEGSKVAITGFGTFGVSTRKERKGRNPRTGEEITIPASKSPRFTAGKALKDELK